MVGVVGNFFPVKFGRMDQRFDRYKKIFFGGMSGGPPPGHPMSVPPPPVHGMYVPPPCDILCTLFYGSPAGSFWCGVTATSARRKKYHAAQGRHTKNDQKSHKNHQKSTFFRVFRVLTAVYRHLEPLYMGCPYPRGTDMGCPYPRGTDMGCPGGGAPDIPQKFFFVSVETLVHSTKFHGEKVSDHPNHVGHPKKNFFWSGPCRRP